MQQITLGSTGITTVQNAFGALPVQRVNMDTAVEILQRAYEGGMRFFDTARAYSDSEEKMGEAFDGMRDKIFIATKTMAKTPEQFWKDLDTSLKNLRTDYIDIYQFHCVNQCYAPGDGTGMYECMLEAKAQGKLRHIGVTAHKIEIAFDCVKSGLYETMQFPFSYLSAKREIELVEACKAANMGFIAMKGLAGGLIHNSRAAMAFMTQYANVLPIWGIQRMSELEEWLAFMDETPEYDGELKEYIEKERAELAGDFCRGCGYCMPCPAGVNIPRNFRIWNTYHMYQNYNTVRWNWEQEIPDSEKAKNCIKCGKCEQACPQKLKIREDLARVQEDLDKKEMMLY